MAMETELKYQNKPGIFAKYLLAKGHLVKMLQSGYTYILDGLLYLDHLNNQ